MHFTSDQIVWILHPNLVRCLSSQELTSLFRQYTIKNLAYSDNIFFQKYIYMSQLVDFNFQVPIASVVDKLKMGHDWWSQLNCSYLILYFKQCMLNRGRILEYQIMLSPNYQKLSTVHDERITNFRIFLYTVISLSSQIHRNNFMMIYLPVQSCY